MVKDMDNTKQLCGLQQTENNITICFLNQKPVTEHCGESCPDFIQVMMDGDEPFTPEQHLMMAKDNKTRQGMKNIRGMKF